MKRLLGIVSMFLVIISILTSFAACNSGHEGGKTDTSGSDTSGDGETKNPAKDKWGRDMVYSPLPEDLRFKDGTTITFLVRDNDTLRQQYEPTVISSDRVDEAVVKRNNDVMDRLNVDIKFLYIPEGRGNVDFHNKIMTSAASGDHEFDVVSTFAYYSSAMVYQGYFANLLDFENLHLEMPYWNQSYINEAKMYNQLYMTVGDLSLSSLFNTFCMFFNKEELERFHPGLNLYDVVRKGDWTIDYFKSLIKKISFADLNSNNEFDGEDYYALMTTFHSFSADAFYAAYGLKNCEKDAEGIPHLSLNNQKTISAYETVKKLLHRTRGVYVADNTDINTARTGFTESRSVFSVDMLRTGAYYSQNMVPEFGVLPMFKGTKEQKGYTTTAQDSYDALAVMANIDDEKIPAVGATLDLMCYKSYMNVRPEYFEVVTKIMYSSGDDDAEMYDTIINGTYYDYGMINSHAISRPNIGHFWRTILADDGLDFMSSYKASESIYESGLKAFVKQFEDMQ